MGEKMSKMIIMRGLPGSGKSFLARQIYDYLHHKHCYDDGKRPIILSTDDYFMVGDIYKWDASLIGAAHKWNQRRVSIVCNLGYNVIVDNTNLTVQEMHPYLQIANDFEYWVELAVPQTGWAFSTATCTEKTTHNVPYATIVNMHGRFESCVLPRIRARFPDLHIEDYKNRL